MIYVFNISTPANTAENAKQETELKIAYGVISHVDIQFPPGPVGLLHLQVRDALFQLWPINPDADFASNNVNISFREFIPVLTEPFLLKASTWNEDDTHSHRVILRVNILPPRLVAPWLLSFEEQIASVLGGT